MEDSTSDSDEYSSGSSSGSSESESSNSMDVEETKGTKPHEKAISKDVEERRTLFVRNLPLSAAETEVQELFEQFGEVKKVLLTKDKTTGELRGTGFVEYESAESAAICMEEAYRPRELLAEERSRKDRRQQGKHRKDSKSVNRHVECDCIDDDGVHLCDSIARAIADVAESESELSLHGRNLILAYAVSREALKTIVPQKDGDKKIDKAQSDKRNISFADFGLLIKKDSPESKGRSHEEMKRRDGYWTEKKATLASTNFHVNVNRICIRGLNKNISRDELKQIVFRLLKEGNAKRPIVKQVKLLAEKETGASKGIAFVELEPAPDHPAKILVTKLNQIGSVSKCKYIIADFALDNMQVVRGREEKILKVQRSKAAGDASGADDANNTTTTASSTAATPNNTNSAATTKVGKFEFNPAALKDGKDDGAEGAKKRKFDDAASSGEEGAGAGKKKMGRGARQREKKRQAKAASEGKDGARVESWTHVQIGGLNSLNLNDSASLKNSAKNAQKASQKGQPPQKKPKVAQPQLTREQIKEKKKALRENPFYFPPSAMKDESDPNKVAQRKLKKQKKSTPKSSGSADYEALVRTAKQSMKPKTKWDENI